MDSRDGVPDMPSCALPAGDPNRDEEGHCRTMDDDVFRLPYLHEHLPCEPPRGVPERQWVQWKDFWEGSDTCYKYVVSKGNDAQDDDQPGRNQSSTLTETKTAGAAKNTGERDEHQGRQQAELQLSRPQRRGHETLCMWAEDCGRGTALSGQNPETPGRAGLHEGGELRCRSTREEEEPEVEDVVFVQREKRGRSPSPRRRRRHRREEEQRRNNRQKWMKRTPSRAPATSTCSTVTFPRRPWHRQGRHWRPGQEEEDVEVEVEEIPDTAGARGSADPAPVAPPLPDLGQLHGNVRWWADIMINGSYGQ